MKKNQKIFRVVIVKGGEIIWASSKFFATEQSAINDIEERVSEWRNTYKVEKYSQHPWDSFQMNEGETPIWLTVHMIANVINEKKYAKSTYGVVEYELM
ncbi:hypothetical protein [Prevotella sp. KH2C16]|uniref:hypothetical protein n=1 Tax=Prevotella sp. KH2C16 TaxID=1855325 RepID=UPI0008F19F08|nr:hypothetical protein [Prevotella sp. KH2C16]SFG56451.1 hypothetical protein SAMN05216383_12060 [Prevotella sp. KH2C16]